MQHQTQREQDMWGLRKFCIGDLEDDVHLRQKTVGQRKKGGMVYSAVADTGPGASVDDRGPL